MTPIEECDYDIRRYQSLRNRVKSIIVYLEKYDSKSEEFEKKINGAYLVDNEKTNISKRITDLKDDVHKTSNYLKYTIIPNIDECINRLRKTRQLLEAAANIF
ncbi:MAG: hypothetical protein IJO63_05655 [Bacilli bacterium]|nr:hypothetical protein [Bacilli bacterium]